MALTPLSYDAVIFEYSYTVGIGTYTLAGAFSGCLPFSVSPEFAGGATGTYHVTNGSPGVASDSEIATGVYNPGAKTLTRASIVASTNGGAPVNWSGRTRLLIRALVPGGGGAGLPLCATPATDGQDLVWDGVNNDWCPDQRVIGRPAAPASGNPGALTKIHGGAGNGVGDGGGVEVLGGLAGASGSNGNVLAAAGNNSAGDAALTLAGFDNFGDGGNVTIAAGQPSIGGAAGNVAINAGDDLANLSGAKGGDLSFFAGGVQAGDGLAGKVEIHAGSNFVTGTGGQVIINAGGSANGDAGNTSIGAGAGGLSSGKGGDVGVNAGSGGAAAGIGSGGVGGGLLFGTGSGGSPDGVAGDVTFTVGVGSGTGRDGLIIILRPGGAVGLPNSNPGVPGALWNNGGVVNISP